MSMVKQHEGSLDKQSFWKVKRVLAPKVIACSPAHAFLFLESVGWRTGHYKTLPCLILLEMELVMRSLMRQISGVSIRMSFNTG